MAGDPRAGVIHTQQDSRGSSGSAVDVVHITDAPCVSSIDLHLLFPDD